MGGWQHFADTDTHDPPSCCSGTCFRSTELARLSQKGERGGSVFISEPDPTRSKPFRPLTPDRAFPIREIAFDGGSYLVLTRDGKQVRRRRANELAADLVKAFLAHYLE